MSQCKLPILRHIYCKALHLEQLGCNFTVQFVVLYQQDTPAG
ncbi:hypothetical protein [Enterocloster bolteae]|nr:hypothetical protein [Enterocloster bolteae]